MCNIDFPDRIHLQCRRPQFNSWVGKIPWRRDRLLTPIFLGFPCGSVGKESDCNVGDLGLIPGLGRSPGEGKGYPLQYNPWGQKESDTTEQLLLSLFMCRCEERSMKNIPTEDTPITEGKEWNLHFLL